MISISIMMMMIIVVNITRITMMDDDDDDDHYDDDYHHDPSNEKAVVPLGQSEYEWRPGNQTNYYSHSQAIHHFLHSSS